MSTARRYKKEDDVLASSPGTGDMKQATASRVKRSSKKDVDRSPEFRWLAAHGEEYRGQWVAISGDQLVAHSDSLKALLEDLKTRTFVRKPLLHKLVCEQ